MTSHIEIIRKLKAPNSEPDQRLPSEIRVSDFFRNSAFGFRISDM
jgi:hypothetical protein